MFDAVNIVKRNGFASSRAFKRFFKRQKWHHIKKVMINYKYVMDPILRSELLPYFGTYFQYFGTYFGTYLKLYFPYFGTY